MSLSVQAHRTWSMLDVVHGVGYFSTENRELYKALHLRPRYAYFAARCGAMGPVSGEVCTAVFYVFSPALVGAALPAAWDVVTPEQVLAARHQGVRATLTRVLGETLAQPGQREALEEAADLARRACAGLTLAGRPVYAAHAALPWPQDDPLMTLWHASTLLREHRGDGHMSTLLHAPLDPVEALVTSGLDTGTTSFLKANRGWTPDEWAAGEQRLRERGLVADRVPDDGALRAETAPSGAVPAGAAPPDQTAPPTELVLTAAGQELRDSIERQTDLAAMEGWVGLGVEGARRLGELVEPWMRLILASGVFPADMGLPRR